MNDQNLTRDERVAVELTTAITRRPWWAILAMTLLMLATGSGIPSLEFSSNYRAYFGPNNPELRTFDEFQKTYTNNDSILIVLKPESGSVFTPRIAGAIERLTEEAWQIPFAIRVDSISNFQYTWADGDDLTVEDLIRNGETLGQAELERRKAIALAEPRLRDNLLSSDTTTTGINVTLQYPEIFLTEVMEAVAAARSIAAGIRADYPDVTVVMTGMSMLNNAFAEAGRKDTETLMPLMYVVLVVFMFVVLRGITGALVTVAVIAFSTVTAFGLGGWAGVQLTSVSATATVIIMTLAVADSVHILTTMLVLMREGLDKSEALRETMRINFLAVSVTSLTTIVGFTSLNFSDSPPFNHLGNLTAVGIAAAWLYSVVLLPALVCVCPLKVTRHEDRTTGLVGRLGRLSDFVTRRHRTILILAGALAVTLIAFVPTLELNDDFVRYFDHRVEFRRDADFAIENLGGFGRVEYSVEAAGPGSINAPDYLVNLERLAEWLRAQPEVTHVSSYTDIVKKLNLNMHGDDPDWYRLPDDQALAAQYLLLYELSLPYGLDLNSQVDIDKAATRLTSTLGDLTTMEIRAFLDRAQAWMESNLPRHMWTEATGASVMFSYISKRNIESMLRGNVFAILIITLLMILTLRNVALGALSIIPNAVPILMTYGVWAIAVGQVGLPAAAISATTLGIIVDDTVHFLVKYQRARREKGLETPAAIRYAFETVGLAMVSTTIILASGFAVLAASTFRINAQMGLLTALAIVIALAVDFLLLPSLLMIGYRKPTRKEPAHADTIDQTT